MITYSEVYSFVFDKLTAFTSCDLLLGNTPFKGYRHTKGDINHITSRIIGVEVHCGSIHGTFLYYTDNLLGGGSNIVIEVTRQGGPLAYSLLHMH